MFSKKFVALLTAASLLTAGPAMAQSSAVASAPARAGATLADSNALGEGGINPLEIAAIIGAAIFLYFYIKAGDDDDEDLPTSP